MASKTTHVIVPARHPRFKRALYVLLSVAVLAGCWGMFDYGRSRAGFDSRAAREARDALATRILDLETENKRLSSQNAVLEQAREIDRRAYAEVDQNLATLQDELLELKQESAFYRRLVNASGEEKGLQIESVKLQRDSGSPAVRYRLVLTQYVTPPGSIQGEVRMTLNGLRNGTQAELSQQELLGGDKSALTFRFRHFQELAGSLTLPEGFVPLRLQLKVMPRDSARPPVERSYSWTELFS
ncbi:MAG: hypothetical protein IT488_14375 [Gammaproteobacteria bacterium]|nr:hypothetical protein [Gammaproteobacteria bacterium]